MISLIPLKQARVFRWLVLLVGSLLFLDIASFLLAEGLWFQEIGYVSVFVKRTVTLAGLGLLAFGGSLAILWGNLAIAQYHSWPYPPETKDINRLGQARGLELPWLLTFALGLGLGIGILGFYHTQVALSHWYPNLGLDSTAAQIPVKFRPEVIGQIVQQLVTLPWQLAIVVIGAIAFLIYPRILVGAIALLISFGLGAIVSKHWYDVLAALNAAPFGQTDPIFGHDLSFFIFWLPVWELLEFWLMGVFSLSLMSVSLLYLLSNDSLSQGFFPGFSCQQQRHLCGLGGCLMLVSSLSYWLDRYELVYSTLGVSYGASYTDVTAQLPANTLLSLLSLAIALFLLTQALFRQDSQSSGPTAKSWRVRLIQQLGLARHPVPFTQHSQHPTYKTQNSNFSTDAMNRVSTQYPTPTTSSPRLRTQRPVIIIFALYLALVAIAAIGLPLIVQRLIVQPNELELEQPYILRTIALTRDAFNLDVIDVENFNPQYALNLEALQRNNLTIENIRLWDTRPLLETNRQLQRFRQYYEFPNADIDRYTLPTDDGGSTQQQVLIAARELDYNAVPAAAQTWINQHLIYTHGYGFTLSPVNTAGEGGLPDYYVQGIEQSVSDERIRQTIPLGSPRIYYGQLTNTYVMAPSQVRELDYPSGSDNVYNTYDGQGGVAIGSFWRRLLYAKHLRDWQMLLTENFNPQTRILFRRQIDSRVKAIAPFLRYDRDPYLVVADPGPTQNSKFKIQNSNLSQPSAPNTLYWLIDAYTTSDHYPYADPGNNDFNYIRNSVKVIVDAYNGSVMFYVSDPTDPLIQTWTRTFPNMFQPLDAMPPPLRRHIRYPQDFYRVQSEQLMAYHMTDPQVFYNREDLWRAPNEIYADEPQLVEPYYLIMKLPSESSEEFILFRPYTPNQRTNLIAWLAARSDERNYGKMLLYNFPKQELVYGPEQLEARINQDPVISQQISLWNRRGSRAIQGNLLVIPIERSLLYIEPLYLEAEQNRLPILARVIVAYGNRIVMAESLQKALDAIFQPNAPTAPVIVRPFEDPGVPPLNNGE
jgi:uncharacterized protein